MGWAGSLSSMKHPHRSSLASCCRLKAIHSSASRKVTYVVLLVAGVGLKLLHSPNGGATFLGSRSIGGHFLSHQRPCAVSQGAEADLTTADGSGQPTGPAPLFSETVQKLLELAPDGTPEFEALIDESLPSISPQDMIDLQMQLAEDKGDSATAARTVIVALQNAGQKRIGIAKDQIEDLLSNAAGDVNQKIRKLLKSTEGESPLPLLMVLQLNIETAQAEGNEDKVRALMHVYSVINEELEKKVPAVQRLLNRLMRMDDAGVRDNLLRHHLTPVEVGASSDEQTDEFETPQLMAAMVTPSRLAEALTQLIDNVDSTMKLGDNSEDRFEAIDRIRVVAKEARFVVGDLYGEGEMNQFGADLTPAFSKLMEFKALQQEEKSNPEPEPEPEPVTPQ